MRIRHWDICAGHSEYGSIKIVKCLTWNKKHQRLTEHIFVTLRANGRNKSQNCWATMMGVVTSVCTWLNYWPVSNFAQQLPTTLNNIQQGVQTDSTCNIQQCWELLANNVASVCTLLNVWPVSNFAQQLPTTLNNIQQGVQTDSTCNIQQCWELLANNVASVCTLLNVWPVSNFAQQLPTTLNNIQQGVQTDSTCNIQQCWQLLANNVAYVCTGLKTKENNNRNKSARLPIKQWFKCPICLSTEFKIRMSILIHSRNIEEREEELGKSSIDDMVKDVGKK